MASTPRCPLRPDDPCSLCQPGASGPQDCGLVYLVMDDEDLRDLYREQMAKRRRERYGEPSHSSPPISAKER